MPLLTSLRLPLMLLSWSLLTTLLLACPACRADDSSLPTVPVEIKGKKFTLEVAATPATLERGLMYRDDMPANHGMIFVFPQPGIHPFWMHHTRIDLDVIWLDADCKVIHIETLQKYDETPRGPKLPAAYVIELNAGQAKNLTLKRDDKIALPEKDLKALLPTTEK